MTPAAKCEVRAKTREKAIKFLDAALDETIQTFEWRDHEDNEVQAERLLMAMITELRAL